MRDVGRAGTQAGGWGEEVRGREERVSDSGGGCCGVRGREDVLLMGEGERGGEKEIKGQ